MKKQSLVAAFVAATLAVAGSASAQDRHDDHRDDHRPPAPARKGPPPRDHHGERGGGPNHDFYKGERLPAEYRDHQHVVDDWRGHRLNAPPRGYHWVQAGGDYVLAAIATGVIAQLVFGN